MLLREGVKLKGRPADIPDCSRDDLPAYFKELGYKRGAEIGVYKGDYSRKLAEFGGELFSIDPWRMYKDYGNPRGQKRLDDQFQIATERLAPFPNVKIVRKTSMEALDDFEDGSLDFVYIDGNHQFAYVAEDIYHWAIKVRAGGIIAGHDYARYKSISVCGGCHAKEVVDAYITAYNIPNFWILGSRKKKREDEVRDQFRSWMFFKDYETPQHQVKN